MKEINITGQKREALGKKASKQYRKEGLVPCNIYGEKKCENGRPVAMSFVAPMSELRKLVYTPHIYVVNLIIDGESHPAIMKELTKGGFLDLSLITCTGKTVGENLDWPFFRPAGASTPAPWPA